MTKLFVLCTVLAATSIAACDKAGDQIPVGVNDGTVESIPADRPRDVRPPPATSGMSSDPNNPNGVPGPISGTGTSSNRY